MEVGGEFHAPATLPLGKNPDTNWIGGCVGTRARLHGFGEEIVCCTCKDSNPGTSSPWTARLPFALSRRRCANNKNVLEQDSEENSWA